MTDGAAKLLSTHLSSTELDSVTRRVFQDAYDRLTSRDHRKAWTSGQWMTERGGGSDVSGTETIATYTQFSDNLSASDIPLGPWSIDGFKWFSSATDSSMTVLLAQTPNGLSTFFAPMYRKLSNASDRLSQPGKELNGIHIQRLKNKFGTKSLPTAELELSGTRAYLIGKEGQGIQEISAILNITRLYSAVSAVGYLGRGLAIAKSFAKVREVGAGKGRRVILKDSPLHINTLAKVAGEYHSLMLFTFFGAWLLGVSEHSHSQDFAEDFAEASAEASASRMWLLPDEPSDIPLLLRILFPVLKASVCKRSIHALQECMEALGGVGYLDNTENESINIARLYRDCCVLSIWEGTTDVLASDMVRVLAGCTGNDVLNALDRWVSKALGSEIISPRFDYARSAIGSAWETLKEKIQKHDHEVLLPSARDTLFKIADMVMGVLLVIDAAEDMNSATVEACFGFFKAHGLTDDETLGGKSTLKQSLELDQKIVYGDDIDKSFIGHPKL
jgi:alkylation response protein AidB-like acyl-CoA dehydrogenase